MKKTLKTALSILLAAALISLFTLSCNKPKEDKGEKTAVQKTITFVWPPQIEDAAKIELTKNLLAKNYYFVLDDSGSMHSVDCSDNMRKITVAKKAIAEFIKAAPPGSNIGLLSFDDKKYTEWVALTEKSDGNLRYFLEKLKPIKADGGTPLSVAVRKGYEALERQAIRQLGYGEYYLIVVTDGQANFGYDPTQEIERILTSSPVVIHTIGFCIGENHPLNQPGRTVYSQAKNPEELEKGLMNILAESEAYSDPARFD